MWLKLPEYLSEETIEQAEILMKYEGYLEKEQENADKLKRLEDLELNRSLITAQS